MRQVKKQKIYDKKFLCILQDDLNIDIMLNDLKQQRAQ